MSREPPSPKPRIDKLGVKRGARVVVLGVRDADFLAELRSRTGEIATRVRKDTDLIFYRAEARADLDRLERLRAALVPDGAIWVVRPKGVKAITEMDVIEAGKRASLVDNKVVAFSVTHTAERLVIPVALRRR